LAGPTGLEPATSGGLDTRFTGSHCNAVMATRKRIESKVAEIDRSTLRYLLTLTPEERIRLAAAEARNLHRFDLEVEKSKGR
jgi:hypothetical protein